MFESCAESGKRIAIGVDDDIWLVLHLMIAGRLHWKAAGAKLAGAMLWRRLIFQTDRSMLTEAGSKRRASLYVVRGEEALRPWIRAAWKYSRRDLRVFAKALIGGEPDTETCAHRSAVDQRSGQRVFG